MDTFEAVVEILYKQSHESGAKPPDSPAVISSPPAPLPEPAHRPSSSDSVETSPVAVLPGTPVMASPVDKSHTVAAANAVITVRQAATKAQGDLDGNTIRRILRSRINEFRFCYQQALTREPTLRGRVTLQFVIDPRGNVKIAKAQPASLSLEELEACSEKTVRRIKFPRSAQGGETSVMQPLDFSF